MFLQLKDKLFNLQWYNFLSDTYFRKYTVTMITLLVTWTCPTTLHYRYVCEVIVHAFSKQYYTSTQHQSWYLIPIKVCVYYVCICVHMHSVCAYVRACIMHACTRRCVYVCVCVTLTITHSSMRDMPLWSGSHFDPLFINIFIQSTWPFLHAIQTENWYKIQLI